MKLLEPYTLKYPCGVVQLSAIANTQDTLLFKLHFFLAFTKYKHVLCFLKYFIVCK